MPAPARTRGLERAYAYLGESGDKVVDEGAETAEERALGFARLLNEDNLPTDRQVRLQVLVEMRRRRAGTRGESSARMTRCGLSSCRSSARHR